MDVPNFFWDSEPTLHPLYAAIRDYLEIDPRIKVLNERCRVFLDLAEILSDSIADAKMSAITWIIIVLIIVSIFVTVTEVAIRFGMLSKANQPTTNPVIWSSTSGNPPLPFVGENVPLPPSDLELLANALGLQANATIDDVYQGISALKSEKFLSDL